MDKWIIDRTKKPTFYYFSLLFIEFLIYYIFGMSYGNKIYIMCQNNLNRLL
jgi:hypothetical protein